MQKLIVYFTVNKMTDARSTGDRQYETIPMREDFDVGTIPEVAIDSIIKKYGAKPEQRSATEPSLYCSHEFAEIKTWRISEVFDRPKEAVDVFVQPELL